MSYFILKKYPEYKTTATQNKIKKYKKTQQPLTLKTTMTNTSHSSTGGVEVSTEH